MCGFPVGIPYFASSGDLDGAAKFHASFRGSLGESRLVEHFDRLPFYLNPVSSPIQLNLFVNRRRSRIASRSYPHQNSDHLSRQPFVKANQYDTAG